MTISFEQVGLFLQMIGVLIVLLSQTRFGYSAWRRFRSLRRTFMAWIGPVHMGAGETEGKSDEYLKKTLPDLWALASYLREDLWTTAIGLVITLIGLICELSSLTLII